MADLTSPRTPPTRPTIQRRMDSFPTDDTYEESEFGMDDGDTDSGMPASVSLGAFPMFLLQESPTRPGAGKPSTSESTNA
jgi:hypothetical protein